MKKLSLLLVLGAICLSLLAISCGGGGGGGISANGISGGAAKAPIKFGNVYINDVYSGQTDANGNFTVGSVNYGGSGRALVQIRGGQTNLKTYPAGQVVLEGYLYKGDSTIYLSTFSMLQKAWIDGGLSREEAQSRCSALYQTCAAMLGINFGSVDVNDNPTASNAFEAAQQALLSFLGVSESTADDIYTDLVEKIGNELADVTDITSFNTDLTNFATVVVAKRENILAATTAARGLTTALQADATLIGSAVIGVNGWRTDDAGTTYTQGVVVLDAGGGSQDVDFAFTRQMTGAAGGSGLIEVAHDGTVQLNNTGSIYMSTAPAIPTATFKLAGATAMATATDVKNNFVRMNFNPGTLTETEKRALLGKSYQVTFYAASNANIKQSFTVRFTYAAVMGNVETINTAGFGDANWVRDATFNFGASNDALYIDSQSRVDLGDCSDLTADVAYSGANNLDGVFLRFVAPAGFKFNRMGWSRFHSNIDIYYLDETGGSPITVAVDSTNASQVKGTGNFYLVATSDQPVGKKTFQVQAIDKTYGTVLASNSSNDDPFYFTTTDSLNKIASMTLTSYAGDATPTYSELGVNATKTITNLGLFSGTVQTWGTLSGQHTNGTECDSLDEVTNSRWYLSVWNYNADDVSGFSYGGGATAADWAQNLDVVYNGVAVDGITATSIVANNCTLEVDPGVNSMFKAYYYGHRFNVDTISVNYEFDDGTDDAYSKSTNGLDFTPDP